MPDQCVWERSIGTSIWTNRLVGLCCFCLSFLCCCLTLSFSCVCETSGNHVLNGGNNSFLGCHFFRTRHISFGEIDKNVRSGLVFFCARALLCIRTWSRRDTLLNQMGIGVWCVHRWCRSMYSLILHDCRDSMVRLRPMMVQIKRLWCRRWSFCLSLMLWQSSKKRRPFGNWVVIPVVIYCARYCAIAIVPTVLIVSKLQFGYLEGMLSANRVLPQAALLEWRPSNAIVLLCRSVIQRCFM